MKFKKILLFSLCLSLLLSFRFQVCADESGSGDLVILQKALLQKIEYSSDWVDVNSDEKFDILDLIRLKKHISGIDVECNSIKYIDVTFISGEKQTVQRLYTSRCSLPELESPYLYWKIGKNYYNAKSIHYFNSDTVITATESKKDVDFPFIDF